MTLFRILESAGFKELYPTLEFHERNWIEKIKLQLEENPFVGDSLQFRWFREKRFEGKRLYYLVSEKKQCVLLVGFDNKKKQQRVIDKILQNKEKYLQFIEDVGVE